MLNAGFWMLDSERGQALSHPTVLLEEASRCWMLDPGCWIDLAVEEHASEPASSIAAPALSASNGQTTQRTGVTGCVPLVGPRQSSGFKHLRRSFARTFRLRTSTSSIVFFMSFPLGLFLFPPFLPKQSGRRVRSFRGEPLRYRRDAFPRR